MITRRAILLPGANYPDVARRSGHEIVELTDADHGLERAGDPVGSVDDLRTVISAVERFVGGLAERRE